MRPAPFERKKSQRLSFSSRLRVQSIDDEASDLILEIAPTPTARVVSPSPPNDSHYRNNEEDHNYSKAFFEKCALKTEQEAKQEINLREREIFLRAALQLLDLTRDGTVAQSNAAANSASIHTPAAPETPNASESKLSTFLSLNSRKSAQSQAKKNSFTKIDSENIKQDVIRYGILKKAGRPGTFSGLGMQWRKKYVELRHGQFCYEDLASHGKTNSSRKIINLSVMSCQCRAFKVRSNPAQSDCVFELTLFGGARRLFLAGSKEERDMWVKMIKIAMEGSAGDFMGTGSSQLVILNNKSDSKVNSDAALEEVIPEKSTFQSREGPAAAFALEISKYNSIQSALKFSTKADEYKEILEKLKKNDVEVTVPVFYVKFFAPFSKFSLSSKDVSINSVECSQVWKDLQRDSIVVNNELIIGENGAEAMVGALMRHLLDHVEYIRRDPSHCEKGDIIGQINASKCKDKFELSESEALICSRDLLVLCNRTQSGGDTYFCIDSLLCNNSNKTSDPYCILTPHNSQADPMIINIDIVEELPRVHNSNFSEDGVPTKYKVHGNIGLNNSGINTTTPDIRDSLSSSVDVMNDISPIEISFHDDGDSEYSLSDQNTSDLNNTYNSESNSGSYPKVANQNPNSGDSNNNVLWDDNISVISDITIDTSLKTSNSQFQNNSKIFSLLKPSSSETSKPPVNKNSCEGGQQQSVSPVSEVKDKPSVSKNSWTNKDDLSLNEKTTRDSMETNGNENSSSPRNSSGSASNSNNFCIRIEVSMLSRYRICDADPQDDVTSVWAEVLGTFQQVFFIRSGCKGKPLMSDRTVSISINDCST